MRIAALEKPRVLLLYKRSSFLATRGISSAGCPTADRFRKNHLQHYKSLHQIESILKGEKIVYRKRCRSRKIDYRPFDLVITVGGDGTFLEAARKLTTKQYILGVNSDPDWSVGQFCSCNASGFLVALRKILAGHVFVKRLFRLRLMLPGAKTPVECLNDILICHPNPAAMSRYNIQIGKTCEEHRSSGIWFSTAAGSTGAIFSAGGKKMNIECRCLQYRPRELYHVPGHQYRLTGAMLSFSNKVTVTSRMSKGTIFIDGAHIKFAFPYGTHAIISISPNFVNMLHV